MSRGRQYDGAITIFSPEGRIYQVEYALELVKRGSPIVGVKSPDGVVLAAIEPKQSRLAAPINSKKIYQIDEHVAVDDHQHVRCMPHIDDPDIASGRAGQHVVEVIADDGEDLADAEFDH